MEKRCSHWNEFWWYVLIDPKKIIWIRSNEVLIRHRSKFDVEIESIFGHTISAIENWRLIESSQINVSLRHRSKINVEIELSLGHSLSSSSSTTSWLLFDLKRNYIDFTLIGILLQTPSASSNDTQSHKQLSEWKSMSKWRSISSQELFNSLRPQIGFIFATPPPKGGRGQEWRHICANCFQGFPNLCPLD